MFCTSQPWMNTAQATMEQAMPKAMRDMGAELSALSTVPLLGGGTITNLGGVNIVVYGA